MKKTHWSRKRLGARDLIKGRKFGFDRGGRLRNGVLWNLVTLANDDGIVDGGFL